GLPGPVFFLALGEIESILVLARLRILFGPWGAHLDPGGQIGDDRIGKLPVRRHLEIDVLVPDPLDEPALAGMARNDSGPGLATLERGLATVQAEFALELGRLGGMAAEAVLDKNGPDFLFEELQFLRSRIGRRRRGSGTEDGKR